MSQARNGTASGSSGGGVVLQQRNTSELNRMEQKQKRISLINYGAPLMRLCNVPLRSTHCTFIRGLNVWEVANLCGEQSFRKQAQSIDLIPYCNSHVKFEVASAANVKKNLTLDI